MSQPRYAPAGFQFSTRGVLFGITVLALATLLGVPMVARAAPNRHPVAVAAPTATGDRLSTASGGDQLLGVGRLVVHPLPVSTNQPAQPAQPVVVNEGVFGPAGDMGQLGIPTMVLKAYQLAATELASEQPSCHLPWWILAGIGHTESGHAESGRLYADGTTRGRILGPVLDGTLADNAIIPDTDHGVYDGDKAYDRAVGPMQFIPSTWVHWAADGNHDGKRDPNNIFDATLAAGRYLCADGRDLATMPDLQAAVLSYNHSQVYLDTVLAWGLAYRNGASAIADLSSPVINDVTKVRPPLTARPPKKPTKITSAAPASSAKPAAADSGSTATSSAASSSSAGSSSATASPSASCTAPSSSAAPSSSTVSASADAHSVSGQPASPATSADGGSATVTATTSASADGTDPQSSAATPAPTGSPTCTR